MKSTIVEFDYEWTEEVENWETEEYDEVEKFATITAEFWYDFDGFSSEIIKVYGDDLPDDEYKKALRTAYEYYNEN